jgi:2-dehydropantoate 2-reductase
MRIAVVGVGGTGGYFGGLLARAGRDVTFIARGETLKVLQSRGLTVKSKVEGTFTIPVNAVADPNEAGPVDLVLFCVKAYDTAAAARLLPPLVGAGTVVISVQNGIDNEERIAQVIGPDAVIGGVAHVSAQVETPGVILVAQEPARLIFGEFAGGSSERTRRILETLSGARFNADLDSDIRVQLWRKFIFICAFSGVTSLMRLPIGTILQHPAAKELYRGVMEEAAAVGREKGVALPDDVVEQWLQASEGWNPGVYGSMYHDLARGGRMEVESLNGSVVRLGAEAGIATPLNFAVFAALQPYAGGAL